MSRTVSVRIVVMRSLLAEMEILMSSHLKLANLIAIYDDNSEPTYEVNAEFRNHH